MIKQNKKSEDCLENGDFINDTNKSILEKSPKPVTHKTSKKEIKSLTNDQWTHTSKHIKKKKMSVSPKGFASVSELLAACDQFSGSSPEHWRPDLLCRDNWKSAKQVHFDKQTLTHTLTIPLIFGEPVGVFLLGLLLLQQGQQPLLLLTGAIHEVIPWL